MQSFSAHSVLSSLNYSSVTKKRINYSFFDLTARGIKSMPSLSYGVNPTEGVRVVTKTADGKETENTARKGDIIMSGIGGEKYVIRGEKFSKLYVGKVGSSVYPEQGARMVARYTGKETITFKAPWGEDMILKPGDYVVREKDGSGYYRIAKKEYESTYNPVP